MRKIIAFLTFIECYGIKGIIAIFYPAYWSQDVKMVNRGRDVLSFKDPGTHWFRGTVTQMLKALPLWILDQVTPTLLMPYQTLVLIPLCMMRCNAIQWRDFYNHWNLTKNISKWKFENLLAEPPNFVERNVIRPGNKNKPYGGKAVHIYVTVWPINCYWLGPMGQCSNRVSHSERP